jgi:hypothetical protein
VQAAGPQAILACTVHGVRIRGYAYLRCVVKSCVESRQLPWQLRAQRNAKIELSSACPVARLSLWCCRYTTGACRGACGESIDKDLHLVSVAAQVRPSRQGQGYCTDMAPMPAPHAGGTGALWQVMLRAHYTLF